MKRNFGIRRKFDTFVFCRDCDSQIKDWSHECGGTVFDCPNCGCTNEDSVRFEDVEIEPRYDTTKERDLDME